MIKINSKVKNETAVVETDIAREGGIEKQRRTTEAEAETSR